MRSKRRGCPARRHAASRRSSTALSARPRWPDGACSVGARGTETRGRQRARDRFEQRPAHLRARCLDRRFRAGRRGPPRQRGRGVRGDQDRIEEPHPGGTPGRRHRPFRRSRHHPRRHRIAGDAHAQDSGDRPRRADRAGRAGRGQPGAVAGRRGSKAVLRA